MLIKNLLVPKYLIFLIALFWTVLVTYTCLVQSSDVPVINIRNLDKYIHVFFHFVFTFVWFLFFRKQFKFRNTFKPLLIAFLLSIVFGIIIEILQGLVTTTRSAEGLDFLANLIGATLAFFTVIICYKYKILK